jgi:hypothetical protein
LPPSFGVSRKKSVTHKPSNRRQQKEENFAMDRHLVLSWNSLLVAILMTLVPATASALPVAGGAKWGTPGNNGQDLKLGPASSETCFLSGVSGSFVGNPHVSGQPNSLLPASAEVFIANGFWFVRTRAGVGPGVMAHVICIFATANRVEFTWADNLTVSGVPATPNRHCFLRKVWATSGLTGQTNHLTIKKVNGQFTMNGSFVENVGGESGFGGATAVCVDIFPAAKWGFSFTGPTNAANSATATHTLKNSFPNGTPVPVVDVGCFLTEISGKWVSGSPNPLGWNNGAFLVGDPNVSQNWQMTVSNGRQGGATCLK